MSLLTKGNRKLGANVWHFALPAGTSCPGASDYCALKCYAKHGNYRFASVRERYLANWEAAQDLDTFVEMMAAELSQLPTGAVVRIHTSGDFFSVPYVTAWHQIARLNPHLRFYAYTRSWTVPELETALRDLLAALGNVKLWASHDQTMPEPPLGWRIATIAGPNWRDIAPGYIRCPEQTGRKPDCASCGICFAAKLKESARLAFRLH